MSSVVLDSSAIMAWLKQEPGADRLVNHISGALVCTVNLAEVQTKLVSDGDPDDFAWLRVRFLGCESVAFDDVLAREAGSLVRQTKPYGLSLGDRACLALAIQQKAKVYTTDRVWAGLGLPVEVEVIR